MEIWFRLVLLISRILLILLSPICWYRSKKSIPIPPIDNEILLTTATQLAENIRQKKITSEAVITAYITRIRAVNPIINAVVEDRFTAAIEDARKVDEIIASNKHPTEFYEQNKPLLGIPVTVKESCCLQGMSLTSGCLSHRDKKSKHTGRAVQTLLDAGAIPLLVSNTPELCLSWDTTNLLHGTTVNPYDTNRSAGGSSGGEGALVGSGASLLGMSSDIGGSLRIPACLNGVFGHKPSPYIVSNEGHFPSTSCGLGENFLGLGPITRYATDLRLMLRVLAGDNVKKLKLNDHVNVQELNVFVKFGIDNVWFTIPSCMEITDGIKRAGDHLGSLGAKIYSGSFINLEDAMEMSFANLASICNLPSIADVSGAKNRSHGFLETLKSLLGKSDYSLELLIFNANKRHGFFIPRSHHPHYHQMREEMLQLFKDHLGDNGVLLFPSFPTPAPYLHQGVLTMASLLNTMIFSMLGLPATQVPIGLNQKGLPIGIQVIAGPDQDHLCLAVAEELEKKFFGWTPPTPNFMSHSD